MDKKQSDELESLLNNKGNLATIVLVAVPLSIEFAPRFGLAYTLGTITLVALAARWLDAAKARIGLSGDFSFLLTMGGYYLILIALLLAVESPLSPIGLIGIMLVALIKYAYGNHGGIIAGLVMLATVTWIDVIKTGNSFDYESLSELIAYVSIYALLLVFVMAILELTQHQVGRLRSSSDKIKSEHKRLVSLINNIADAVIATDKFGRIQTYNGAALELFDTNQSINNLQINEAVTIQDADGNPVDIIAETAKAGHTVRRTDLVIAYSKNDKANIYVNATPIKIGFGSDVEDGFTLIMRDITKEKSLEEERDEFISVVSHELRTPVTIAEGKISNVQLLVEKPDSDRQKILSSLNEAHEQTVFLGNMINDLSTLSRAERTDVELDRDRIAPAEFVAAMAESYAVEAEQRGLRLETAIAPQLPVIYTSRLYLQEILQNFVTNAMKYTKEGSVTIGVEAGDLPESLEFYVRDSGIGISKSDQKRLFEKFFRSEDYRTRESSGTGLGLYVTLKLAQKIGADISVESELNQGSTFRIKVRSLPEKPKRLQSSAGA